MRVIGIDPGTISIELCGLDDDRVFLDVSLPTRDALSDPAALMALLENAAPLDLVAGPSGYGLPLLAARDLTDADFHLAYLAAAGETGGIGGLRSLMGALARSALPVVLTPGVIHLASVPPHRKINRVDMGTADKVCACVLAIREQAARRSCAYSDVSFILLELGGAFTAAIAVDRGRIVDGMGGTSGPLGARAAGALDGEVAFLAGGVSKEMLFHGGAAAIAGVDDPFSHSADATAGRVRLAWDAYIESATKAAAALMVSVTNAAEVILSGRFALVAAVRERLAVALEPITRGAPIHTLSGFATVSTQAAQGAALMANGLAGGSSEPLIEAMELRGSSGTVLDHLYVVSPQSARTRLGIA